MKFSILIAHYNNFEYFQDCYQSIINQTFQNFEVIIVDDCSTDDSLDKIKQLVNTDPRFKIYKNPENRGVGFTKKRCIELATGEICGFLDPDDALENDALEKISTIFSNHSNIIAIHTQYYECDSDLNTKKICRKSEKVPNKDLLFFNIFYEITHFFCFKKESYLLTLGLDDTLTSAIDQDLYLKLYEKGDFFYIKEPLYLYRIHAKGVSQEPSKKIKLRENWNRVLINTLQRRNIKTLYGKKIEDIDDLAMFIYQKQNTLWKRILRKLK